MHNLGDTFVSLAPAVAGLLTLASGNPFVDPLFGLIVAAAVILPTLRALIGNRAELVWPENVTCGSPSPADAPSSAARSSSTSAIPPTRST